MANLLLNYAIPFSQVTSLPPPSFGFLRRIGVVVPFDEPGTPGITLITDAAELEPLTQYADQLKGFFDGGGTQLYLIQVNDATEVAELVEGRESEFYTLFGHPVMFEQFAALPDPIVWNGVKSTGTSESLNLSAATQPGLCLWWVGAPDSAYNPLLAFGKLLSGAAWRNQQYIPTTDQDGLVDELGQAESYYDQRASFWIYDEDNGNRLALFAVGGQSITTPYISKELEMTIQYQMANALAVAQPFNTLVQRKNLERVGMKVISDYIAKGYLDPNMPQSLIITDSPEAFEVSGQLVTSPAVALWRARIDAFQTQG